MTTARLLKRRCAEQKKPVLATMVNHRLWVDGLRIRLDKVGNGIVQPAASDSDQPAQLEIEDVDHNGADEVEMEQADAAAAVRTHTAENEQGSEAVHASAERMPEVITTQQHHVDQAGDFIVPPSTDPAVELHTPIKKAVVVATAAAATYASEEPEVSHQTTEHQTPPAAAPDAHPVQKQTEPAREARQHQDAVGLTAATAEAAAAAEAAADLEELLSDGGGDDDSLTDLIPLPESQDGVEEGESPASEDAAEEDELFYTAAILQAEAAAMLSTSSPSLDTEAVFLPQEPQSPPSLVKSKLLGAEGGGSSDEAGVRVWGGSEEVENRGADEGVRVWAGELSAAAPEETGIDDGIRVRAGDSSTGAPEDTAVDDGIRVRAGTTSTAGSAAVGDGGIRVWGKDGGEGGGGEGGSRRPSKRGSLLGLVKRLSLGLVDVTVPQQTPRHSAQRRRSSMAQYLCSPTHALSQFRRSARTHRSDSESSAGGEASAVDPYREHLDDAFRETPWKPPSKDIARENQLFNLFGRGHATFFGTSNLDLFVLGEGVGLYFVWLNYLMVVMGVATVLTIPALLISYWGDSFNADDLDPIKFSLVTAGNHQYVNPNYTMSPTMEYCTANGYQTVDAMFFLAQNLPCDSWFFRLWQGGASLLTARHGSYLIMICDVFVCLCFLATWVMFGRNIGDYEKKGSGNTVTTHSYAVYATGFPENTTDEQIIGHFNNLFRLDLQSWSYRGRCGIFGRKRPDFPDEITDHLNQPCIDKLLPVASTRHSRFDHLCKNTWVAECSIVHPEGDFILAAKSVQNVSKRMLEQRAIIKKYSPGTPLGGGAGANARRVARGERALSRLEHTLKQSAHRLDDSATGEGLRELEGASWRCNSAFIIFNHEESYRRCVRDYSPYNNTARRRSQPAPLRFQERFPLSVTTAPSPGNIIWENMEVSPRKRFWHMAMTGALTAVLLLLTFLMIAWASRTKDAYEANLAEQSLCSTGIPEANGLTDQTGVNSIYLSYTADELTAKGYSSTCPNGSTYISLTNSPAQPSSTDACTQPCMDSTAPGFTQEILRLVDDYGPVKGAYYAITDLEAICSKMTSEFLKGQALLIVASVAIVIINIMLKLMLQWVVPFELHKSVTAQARSVAQKTTIALFVNTLLVTLLVNAYIPSDNRLWGNRDGARDFDYKAFTPRTPEWYATAGAAMSLTMAINVFSSHGDLLALFAIVTPLTKRFSDFHSQLQMNAAWQGPQFDIATRIPFALALLSVCMVLSPALPILYPIAFAGITITAAIDRYMLLNYYTKPPQYDAALARWANSFMPVILFLHCAFAVWIYGSPHIFDSAYVFEFMFSSESDLTTYLTHLRANDPTGGIERILRTNCFPFFVILVLLVAYQFFDRTLGEAMRLVYKACTCRCLRGLVARVSKNFNPPFTGTFVRYFLPGSRLPPALKDMLQSNEGWSIRKDDDSCFDMMTWEVIKDSGIHTYHMEDNPDYAYIIYTRNKIVQELGISTPKSPGGKLWNPRGYRNFIAKQAYGLNSTYSSGGIQECHTPPMTCMPSPAKKLWVTCDDPGGAAVAEGEEGGVTDDRRGEGYSDHGDGSDWEGSSHSRGSGSYSEGDGSYSEGSRYSGSSDGDRQFHGTRHL
ncbi:hypothetical protein JKP88DRAFT_274217 [Tribonema minus]|uniref:CSC1/OSCA1-like 7TM region domain-containing protein n=1 Tax=Tribonema minus TaxID=303371 RepID=A0A835YTR8_9STRA|nr:hypothetical protein JKP88DRAFT_274217 [Tribonema minus]